MGRPQQLEPVACTYPGTDAPILVRVLSDKAGPPKGKKTRVWAFVAPKPFSDNGRVVPEVDAVYIDKAP